MPNVLCLTVHFLGPLPGFHGRTDGGEPEWPPSPLRLFQALVDAAANRWRGQHFDDYAKPLLEWLERLRTPTIIAPNAHVGVPVRIAVPNNDMDVWGGPMSKGQEPKKQPNELKTMKTVRPTHFCGCDAIHYLFPLPDGECPHIEVLCAAARSMTHLGWGVDMVAGNAEIIGAEDVAKLPGERWQPTESTSNGLRVPKEGTLAGLGKKHTAFLNRLSSDGFKPVPPLSAFRVVGYRRTSDPPPRRYAAFQLRHPMEDRAAAFDMTHANVVAATCRNVTGRVALQQDWPTERINRYVHGHRDMDCTEGPRFSYLPLPSIERRGERGNVVGAIRRVMVAELGDAIESYLSWSRRMLPGQFLMDERSQEPTAMLVPLTNSDWVLRRYVEPSTTWTTVTPMVLPGSDEGKAAKADKLFLKSLAHAGYDLSALLHYEFRNVSYWPGGELARNFKRPDYLTRGHWSVYHVLLRWKQPIDGPLALGAGRHCGLGVFAAYDNV